MLDKAEPAINGDCCIYRVPFNIRRLNEDAYTPKVVSIGPFHHHRHPRLQRMKRHKLIYCKKFLELVVPTLDSLISYVEELELSVRRCYSDILELTKEELVKVIVVDSGFIIELFWRIFYDEWSNDDTFLLKPWLSDSIVIDLLLLENQFPFFVLEGLFNLSFRSESDRIPSFLDFAFKYFAHYNRSNLVIDNISISHFTDLRRTFHLQPLGRLPCYRINDESDIHIQIATELLEAGVRFEVNTKSNCLLDLRFSVQVLEIPQFRVEDWTEILFRNLVVLEQCHYPYKSYITDYVAVLDFLINTRRDVDVLVQKGNTI